MRLVRGQPAVRPSATQSRRTLPAHGQGQRGPGAERGQGVLCPTGLVATIVGSFTPALVRKTEAIFRAFGHKQCKGQLLHG